MTTTTDETIAVGEAELLACVPHLRAFALFLTRNRDRADDLVQDTIVRALTAAHQFRAGTNLKAWMFTILRNHYFSEVRGNRMKTQSLDEPLAHRPAVPPNQIAGLEFRDFQRAFWQLNGEGREVLILVGASGLSYEEAATICDCPLARSRVGYRVLAPSCWNPGRWIGRQATGHAHDGKPYRRPDGHQGRHADRGITEHS